MSLLSGVFGFDYWRATIWTDLDGLKPFLEVVGLHLGLTEKGHGGIGYKAISDGLYGFQVYSQPSDESVRVTISLPARCMDYVGAERFRAGVTWLCESGLRWNSTRLDLAFDTQEFTVSNVVDAVAAGQYEGVRRKMNENRDLAGGEGHTLYIGSRQSTAYVCMYHKTDGVSYGEEAFTRVELRLHDERADLGLLEIMAAPMELWAERAGMFLSGFMSLAADFWRKWMAAIGTSWLRLRRAASTVERAQRWLEKAVAPSLAMVLAATTDFEVDKKNEFIDKLVRDGLDRLSKLQRANVDRYRGDGRQVFAVYSLGAADA